MEGLNHMVRTAETNGWINGFGTANRSGDNMAISHLLYADDSLILCGADTQQVRHIRAILTIFEALSGLHVNWDKSFIFPVNVVDNLQDLAGNLGCQIGSLPTKYLGMPLGAKNKAVEIWNDVLERCNKKLSRWKSHYLSMGGRLTLISSVLDALPTYMMSVFPIPRNVEKRLNELRREFLWQGNKEKKGINLVRWSNLIKSKQQGGLGIRNLKIHNQSLLQKWLWKFNTQENALWRRFIVQKYALENQWITKKSNGTYGCSVWKTIRNFWPCFSNDTAIKIGNGWKTSFWEEKWTGQETLKNLFPDLYAISLQQKLLVGQVWSPQGWNLNFRRLLNDWEVSRMIQLLQILQDSGEIVQGTDELIWRLNSKGIYTVQEAYKNLNSNNTLIDSWPWKHIWRIKVPPKVSLFMWLVVKEACLTHEKLQRRGFQICSRCFLCGLEVENNSHLFIHCNVTTNLWNMFICLSGVSWVMPNTSMELLENWNGSGYGIRSRNAWRIIPGCIWWTVWNERNKRCFEDKESSGQKIKMNCLALYYFWCKQETLEDTGDLLEVLGSLHLT